MDIERTNCFAGDSYGEEYMYTVLLKERGLALRKEFWEFLWF